MRLSDVDGGEEPDFLTPFCWCSFAGSILGFASSDRTMRMHGAMTAAY